MIGIAEAKRLVSECFPRRTGQTLAFCADTRPLAGSLRPGGDGGLEICVNLRPISREKTREAGNLRARFTVCYLEEEARRLPAMAARKIWLPPLAPWGRMHRRLDFGPLDCACAGSALEQLAGEAPAWETAARLLEALAALGVIAYRGSDLPVWAFPEGDPERERLLRCLIAGERVPGELDGEARRFRADSLAFVGAYARCPEPLARDGLYALGRLNQALDRLWPGPVLGQLHAFGRMGEIR